jgi:hypothetical protein
VVNIKQIGTVYFAPLHEANVNARNMARQNYDKDKVSGKEVLDPSLHFAYVTKTAGSLQKSGGRLVSVSPIGEVQFLNR